jgi:PAS domain S-box-containing protein
MSRPLAAMLVLAATAALFLPEATSAGVRPKLVVGGDHENPPYEYLENGKATGFNVELIRAAAAIAGFDVEIRLGPWAKARRALEQGDVDALSGMYWSEERSKGVDFSVPHTMVRSALFVRKGSPIRSLADLRDKEVIVQEGDVLNDLFKRTGLASRIVAVTDADEQLRVLASGRGDCALMTSRLQGEYYVKRLGLGGLKVIDADLPQLRYCFAVRKGNRELLYRLDEGLNVLKVSGKYKEIYERWFGVYEQRDLWRYGSYFGLALAILTVLFTASLLWSGSLRRQVQLRTAELQASELELRRAHTELERRVEERTAELRRANEQLTVSEAEKAIILNSTADLVTFLDPEMRIQWGNHKAAALAGTTPEGLRGRYCWEAFYGRSETCRGCPAMLAMATGQPQSAELSKPGGKEIFLRAYPIKSDGGRLVGVVEFALDITERKRMEEALRESEEWLRLTVEATGAGILNTVPFGPPTLSPRLREMLGIPDDLAIDGFDAFLRLVHPDDRETIRDLTLKALDPSGDGRLESLARFLRPDGSVRWIAATAKAQFAEVDGAVRAVRLASVNLDITDRKREEQALRESEERFHTLADNIAQLAWMADAGGEIFWFNRRCLDYTGATSDALQMGQFLHPEHVGRVAEKMSRCLSTGEVFEDTFALRGEDNRYRWFLSRAVPVRDAAGEVVRWLGTATDVTAQREVEEALRESEARGRAILASLAEGVVFHGPDGVASSANEAALALLGLSMEELALRAPLPLGWAAIRPDGSPYPSEEYPINMALRTGHPQRDIELGIRRSDGTLVWLSVNAEPMRLSQDRTAGVVVSLFDITQRSRALRKSEEHLRTMADNVPDAIVRYDRTLRHVFANAAAVCVIGAPLDRVIGRTRAEVGMPPDHVAFWDQYLLKVFRTGSPDRFEFGLDGPEGRHYESRLVPERDRDGGVETVLSITRDITDRKRAERQLLASREELRALVARLNSVREEEKARLSRELHDEMGQLLTALRMELEALEDGLGDVERPAAARELLDRAVAASELVAMAIDSMRNLLASLRPVALDRLGLGAALSQECRRFKDWAGIACEFAAADGLSTFGAQVDTALFRIAQEALTNVARHAGASRVAVTLERKEGMAVLRVADDGRGVPAGREAAGLGVLGMRERAECLGGELVVKPVPRGGAMVEARIPPCAPANEKGAP